jgi:hypothetical protein
MLLLKGSLIGDVRRCFTWFQGQACSGEAAFNETGLVLDLLQAVPEAAASSTGRTRLRRRSSRPGPPRCFYPRPGLLLPHLDRAVITLDGPARAQLAGPAAAAQQIPDPGTVYCSPELRPHQVPDPGQRPPLVSPPGRQRPAPSATSSAASCPLSSRHCAACPRGASPARPSACRRRRTDRSLSRSSAALTAVGTPLEPPGRFHPDLLPASSALGGQPAALRIPHPPCIPPQAHTSAPRTSPINDPF